MKKNRGGKEGTSSVLAGLPLLPSLPREGTERRKGGMPLLESRRCRRLPSKDMGNAHRRQRKEKVPKVRAAHSIAEPLPSSFMVAGRWTAAPCRRNGRERDGRLARLRVTRESRLRGDEGLKNGEKWGDELLAADP
nr:hypothetical protein Iba_scaffold13492CG0180 [Ipomoea batatas]